MIPGSLEPIVICPPIKLLNFKHSDCPSFNNGDTFIVYLNLLDSLMFLYSRPTQFMITYFQLIMLGWSLAVTIIVKTLNQPKAQLNRVWGL